MTKIHPQQSQIKTIRHTDPRFHISDGYIVAPRAGFEINQNCPVEYKIVLQECINNGWLIPVAHITDRELLFMGLSDE